jgi:dipeptidase E
MGNLLLTSTGFSHNVAISAFLLGHVADPGRAKVALLTSAAAAKEADEYAQLARRHFLEMGFKEVDFLDVERQPAERIREREVLYVCGGNTYALLAALRRSGAAEVISSWLRAPTSLYVGVSAGSIVAGSSIASSSDPNDVGLDDPRGLGLVPFLIVAHMGPRKEALVARLQAEGRHPFRTLADGEFITADFTGDAPVIPPAHEGGGQPRLNQLKSSSGT